jgi:hypothetical protein
MWGERLQHLGKDVGLLREFKFGLKAERACSLRDE